MDAKQIAALIESQVAAGSPTNHHGLAARKGLVPPRRITVIESNVRKGKLENSLIEVWLVYIEDPENDSSYRIVASLDGTRYWLADTGVRGAHPVVSGWYRDFMSTFLGM